MVLQPVSRYCDVPAFTRYGTGKYHTRARVGGGLTTIEADARDSHGFRVRLLDGLTHSVEERGYRDTTVADIVRDAKTSKRTFYGQFASKEECFIALLAANNDEMITHIRAAVAPDANWDHQIRCAAKAYVDHIASRPAITLSWIREAPALGAAALPLHRVAMGALTDMLVDLTDSPGFRRSGLLPVSRPLALILLGGLRELTALTVEDGDELWTILEPATIAATSILGSRLSPE